MDLLVTSLICYHPHDELRSPSHQIIDSANYFMSLPLPWFIFTGCGDHSFPFWAQASPLSVWVCLLPRLLLTWAINLRVRGEPVSTRLVTPWRERMDLGGESLRRFTRWNRRWESPGIWSYLPSFLMHHLLPLHLMKDVDAFREEVQLELDSILGTQGGTCSQNLRIWRRSLCTEAVLPVTVPSHQISASLYSSKDTSGWGGGWS